MRECPRRFGRRRRASRRTVKEVAAEISVIYVELADRFRSPQTVRDTHSRRRGLVPPANSQGAEAHARHDLTHRPSDYQRTLDTGCLQDQSTHRRFPGRRYDGELDIVDDADDPPAFGRGPYHDSGLPQGRWGRDSAEGVRFGGHSRIKPSFGSAASGLHDFLTPDLNGILTRYGSAALRPWCRRAMDNVVEFERYCCCRPSPRNANTNTRCGIQGHSSTSERQSTSLREEAVSGAC